MRWRKTSRPGVIGLGKMGHPIARHLARNGFAVLGHDIDPAAAQRLSQYGVTAALRRPRSRR